MSLIVLSVIALFSLWTPANGYSADEPEYYQKWLETLKKGNSNEKIYALSYTPDSLVCCKFQKDPAALKPFLTALKDKDHRVREAAAASMGHIRGRSKECCKETEMTPALIRALKDIHPRVREEAVKALVALDDKRAVDALIARIDDKDLWVRLTVAFALGEMGGPRAVDPLLELLEDDSDWRYKFVQQECVISIRKIEFREAFHKKASMGSPGSLQRAKATQQARQKALETGTGIIGLDDQMAARVISAFIRKFDDPYLKMEIIRAIIDFKVLGAREVLIEATQDPNDRVRELAMNALMELSLALREMISPPPSGARIDDPNVDVFIRGLKDPTVKVRLQSVEALRRLLDSRAVEPLIEVSKDSEVEIRAKSIDALGRQMDPRAIGPLIEASQDKNERVKENAIVALSNFAEERILDASVNFILNDPKANLHHSAGATFISVAKKTANEKVFVYRKNGIRYVSKNRSDIPWGIKASERLVHPTAVAKLIDLTDRSNDRGKLSAFRLFSQFEDKRIEKVLLKYFDNPSPEMRGEAISLIAHFSDNSVVPRLILASKDKHGGVREKAIKALGEFQDKSALEPLIGALSDVHPEVRAAALDSLKTYDDPRLSDLVMKRLKDDSLSVRRAAVLNIKERRDRRAVEEVSLLLQEADNDIVKFTVEALEVIGDKKAVDSLIRALKGDFSRNRAYGGDGTLRKDAAKALGSIKDRGAVPALIECLSEEDLFLQRRIVSALEKIGDPAGIEAAKKIQKDKLPVEVGGGTPIRPADVKPPPPSAIPKVHSPGLDPSFMSSERYKQMDEKLLPPKEVKPIDLSPFYQTKIAKKPGVEPKASSDMRPSIAKLKSKDPRVRREAADDLGNIRDREVTEHLIPLLKDKNEYVRQAAARALGKLKEKRAVEPLISGLRDPDIHVKAFFVWALGEIGDPRAIEPLAFLLLDQEEKISDQSFDALRKFRDPRSRTIMVKTLQDGKKRNRPGASGMLWKLTSLEGKDVISKSSDSQP